MLRSPPEASGGLGVLGEDRPLQEQPGAPDVSRSTLFLQGAPEGSRELRSMYCIKEKRIFRIFILFHFILILLLSYLFSFYSYLYFLNHLLFIYGHVLYFHIYIRNLNKYVIAMV